ncbi:response regulator [Spirosoma jeollabukense]
MEARLTCGIIDKSAIQRQLVKGYIARMPELEFSWEAEFQETSYACFEAHIPDLLFMSLRQLPVEVVPMLRPILTHHPGIILTTGYFLKEVGELPFPYVAYLQKPFSYQMFAASVECYKQLKNTNSPPRV